MVRHKSDRSIPPAWPSFRVGPLRRLKAKEEIRFDTGRCALGRILVAATDDGVVAILIGDDPDKLVKSLHERFPDAEIVDEKLDGEDFVARIACYLKSLRGRLDVPLDMRGTPFQRKGGTRSGTFPPAGPPRYSEVARAIGMPRAARAVGSACAANNLAFAVPCHRVLRKDGSLSWGLQWGKARQQKLIDLEAKAALENYSLQKLNDPDL